MNKSVFILNISFLLFYIKTTQQTLCPNSPCECILGGQEIICDSFSVGFGSTLEIPNNLNSEQLKLKNFYNNSTIISKTEIKDLVLENSSITILSDILNGDQSLERLKLIRVTGLQEWDWNWGDMFYQFNKLKEFLLDSSALPKDLIIKTNHQIDSNSIFSFSIINCQISSIDTNVINMWSNLKMISLSYNKIVFLKREWFPSHLNSLWSLDLSYNYISAIPENFFCGMNALRKLRLDNNDFITLNDMWFDPIWNNLREFWINNNPFVCSGDFSWIPNVYHPTFFDEGACLNGNRLRYFCELRNFDYDVSPNGPTNRTIQICVE